MRRLGVTLISVLVLGACVGREFPVSDPVYVPNPHEQHNSSAAAFDGSNFLVVWADMRDDPGNQRYSSIYGARVAPDGTVLDGPSIPIARGPGNHVAPDVTFDGANFLVVWQVLGDGPERIAGARVSPAGAVLDPNGIAIANGLGRASAPAVSAGDGSSFVTWSACHTSCDPSPTTPVLFTVEGVRVASNGTVLDATPLSIASAGAVFVEDMVPDVAFDGTNHLVVWPQLGSPTMPVFDIFGRRVSAAGAGVGNSIPIATSTLSEVTPNVAFDGSNFLAVWAREPVSTAGRIRGTRITPGGVVLDATGFDISTAAGASPAIAFDGTNSLVAWTNSPSGGVVARRVDGGGQLVDSAPIPVASAGAVPALAANGATALVTFEVSPLPQTWSMKFARVSGGTVLDDPAITLSTPASDQVSPAIAFDGTNHFVVWSDRRSVSEYDIYAARVRADGTKLDGTGIAVSTAAAYQFNPAVVYGGGQYFVVWEDIRSGTNDVYGARVTSGGTVLDPGGIQITNTPATELDPAVAFDGTNYFVVWDVSSGGIAGARVSVGGTVLDPGGLTIATTGAPWRPTVAFGGSNFFVAWQASGGVSSWDVFGARVGSDGGVVDPIPITISNASGGQAAPQIAFNGTSYLVAWEDTRTSSISDVYAARLTLGGTVLDPSGIAVSTAADLQREPSVAANGDFLVVWRDDRHRGRATNASDVFGARVTGAGVVRDPSGVSITNSADLDREPVVAPGRGSGSWEVAYRRFAAEQFYGSQRVFHRSVAF
jgi:hypothetical protein